MRPIRENFIWHWLCIQLRPTVRQRFVWAKGVVPVGSIVSVFHFPHVAANPNVQYSYPIDAFIVADNTSCDRLRDVVRNFALGAMANAATAQ